jgi:hypothetical protein
LRKNLNDYEEVTLTQEEENFLIELFSQLIDKKQTGQDEQKLFYFAKV